MKIQLSTIFTLGLAFVQTQAAPHTSKPKNSTLLERDWIDDCGDSTFENDTWCGSPLASDCRILANNIAGGGTWEVEAVTGVNHQLAQFGTCAFGVHGTKSLAAFYVGNSDISNLITSSIDMYAWKGHVASHDQMACQDIGGSFRSSHVFWGIYRNGGT